MSYVGAREPSQGSRSIRAAIAMLVTASFFAGGFSAANAEIAAYSPLSAFGLRYRAGISTRYQDALYAAQQISFKGGDVTPAYAHRASRIFLDSAALPQPSQEARDRYVLFAASSELIAASREAGAAAALSRRNAIALLTPLAQPRFEFFVVSYVNADATYGTGSLVVSVYVDGPRAGILTSPLATISSSLIDEARAESTETN